MGDISTFSPRSKSITTSQADGPRVTAQEWQDTEVSRRKRKRRMRSTQVWTSRIVLLGAALGIWQVAANRQWISPFFYSSPKLVFLYLKNNLGAGEFWTSTWVTLQEAGISFIAGSVAAVITGFVLAQTPILRDVLRPLLTFLNSMPRVALAPLLIIWFGLGMGSKIAVGISLTYFVVLTGTLVGVDSVNPDHKTLCRQLGFSHTEMFRRITLPSSVVSIFAALNLGLVYGFLGVVVAEMLAAPQGLGHLLQVNAGTFRTDGVLGVVLFLGVLVAGLVTILELVEGWLLRWQRQ